MSSPLVSPHFPGGSAPAGVTVGLPLSSMRPSATTRVFRWRARVRHDTMTHAFAGVTAATLVMVCVARLVPAMAMSAAILWSLAIPLSLLTVRASFLYPHESERLDRAADARRRHEDREYADRYLRDPKNRDGLRAYFAAFDSVELMLRTYVARQVGPLADVMVLREQIAYVVRQGVWDARDVELWETCLALRQRILSTQHCEISPSALTAEAGQLADLASRTAAATDEIQRQLHTPS